jgi:hypothetical protein
VRWGVVENSANGSEHAVEIVEDVVIPETEDAVAVSIEFGSALVIRFFLYSVLAAIELDRELRLPARKVDDAPADRMLAAEFPCGEALT